MVLEPKLASKDGQYGGGAPARGDAATDGMFNHETGAGAIRGIDWEPAGRRLRPDYRDAILRGTPVDVVWKLNVTFDYGDIAIDFDYAHGLASSPHPTAGCHLSRSRVPHGDTNALRTGAGSEGL